MTALEHSLKTWPHEFDAVKRGEKTFEMRFCMDRDFGLGDTLLLRKWDPARDPGSGVSRPRGSYVSPDGTTCWSKDEADTIRATVTHFLHGGRFGLPPGLCVMSLSVRNSAPRKEGEADDLASTLEDSRRESKQACEALADAFVPESERAGAHLQGLPRLVAIAIDRHGDAQDRVDYLEAVLRNIADTCIQCPETAQFAARVLDGSAVLTTVGAGSDGDDF